MSQLDTSPTRIEHGSGEDKVRATDFTQWLTGTQAPTNPALSLVDPTGATVTLEDAPVVNGLTVQWRIRVGVLNPGSLYTLTVTMTPSGTTDVMTAITQVYCPS